MTENDLEQFSAAWIATWANWPGKTLSPETIRVHFAALSRYDLADVHKAMLAHISDPERGRFPPTAADIIGKLLVSGEDGRPGPEEAWAMCPMSERDTAWMTQEMSVAQAAATPLIDRDDLIAARKTFLEVYERAVTEARITNKPCSWQKSLGWDQDGRDSPCNENLAMKYLEHHNHKLTAIEWLPDCGKRLSLLAPASKLIPAPPAMNDGKE